MIGIILAGGRSRRMGRDKTLMRLGADPVLERLYRDLKAVTGRAVVVVRAEQVAAMQVRGFEVLPDRIEDCGPMGGIHAALSAFSEDALVLACDLPFASLELMRDLVAHYREASGVPLLARTPAAGGQWRLEPLFAVWPHACLPLLQAALDQQAFSLTRLAGNTRCSHFDLPAESVELLKNINTPDDLNSAAKLGFNQVR